MFIDEARVLAQGGKGGDGIMSMLREKFRPRGGPAGGSGGRGGSVFFQAAESERTLLALKGGNQFRAKPGERGGPNGRKGAWGEDLILDVPVGTLVKDPESGAVLADLSRPGDRFLAARGGRGGRGNKALVRPSDPLPTWAEKGLPGQERWLKLELKVMADVGLLGLPNAGKSTLISVLTAAKPKIAPYPFTTLEPHLGTVMADVRRGGKSFVIADLPGLVEGAHEGVGLGDRFLRHVERTRMVLHLVDVSGFEGRDPADAYRTIRKELEAWHPKLAEKPELVVATKMDVPESAAGLKKLKKAVGKRAEVYAVSSVAHQGLEELLLRVAKILEDLPEGPIVFPPTPVFKPEPDPEGGYSVWREDHDFFVVAGDSVGRLVDSHDLGNATAVDHLDRKLRGMGVYRKLAALGAKEGDTVRVGDFLFDYYPEDEDGD